MNEAETETILRAMSSSLVDEEEKGIAESARDCISLSGVTDVGANGARDVWNLVKMAR